MATSRGRIPPLAVALLGLALLAGLILLTPATLSAQTTDDPPTSEPPPPPPPPPGGPTGSIAVVKLTDPPGADGLFAFEGDLGDFVLAHGQNQVLAGLDPGDYRIAERAPEAWTVTAIVCEGAAATVDLGAAVVTVHLAESQDAVCTFTNAATLEPPPPPPPDTVAIDLEVATNGDDADLPPGPSLAAGDPVVWTYQLVNTGSAPLTGVTVVDDAGTPDDPSDDVAIIENAALAPGEAITADRSAAAAAGQYAAAVRVTTAEGATDEDATHYLAESAPPAGMPNGGTGGLAGGLSGGATQPLPWLAAAAAAALVWAASFAAQRYRRGPEPSPISVPRPSRASAHRAYPAGGALHHAPTPPRRRALAHRPPAPLALVVAHPGQPRSPPS